MTRMIVDINGAAFHPTHDAGFHPTHDAALHPTHDASLHPTSDAVLRSSPSSGAASQVLLTEALRASRAAVVKDAGQKPRTRTSERLKSDELKLWRWEPPYRQEACLFELLSNLRFEKGCLRHRSIEMISMTSPDEDTIMAQARLVLKRTPERGERMAEILVQAEDLWPFWTSLTALDPLTAPFTYELLQLALRFETSVVMRFKHELACPRPAEVLDAIQPVIRTPGHASLPSGHATVAFMMARLLGQILEADDVTVMQLDRLAHRIADNRTVAGLHYPMDSAAGRILGETLANFFLSACTGKAYAFDGAAFDGKRLDKDSLAGFVGDADRLVDKIHDMTLGLGQSEATRDPRKSAKWYGPLSFVSQMWDASRLELQALRYLAPTGNAGQP